MGSSGPYPSLSFPSSPIEQRKRYSTVVMADISQYPVNVSLGSAMAQGVLWEERRQGYWKHLDLPAERTWETACSSAKWISSTLPQRWVSWRNSIPLELASLSFEAA